MYVDAANIPLPSGDDTDLLSIPRRSAPLSLGERYSRNRNWVTPSAYPPDYGRMARSNAFSANRLPVMEVDGTSAPSPSPTPDITSANVGIQSDGSPSFFTVEGIRASRPKALWSPLLGF